MFILPHLKGLTAGNIGSAAFKSASLDLKFADNKSLTDAITGSNLVTFTRASSGTFVDSAGVLQTAVTNLLLRSEEFDDTGVWGNSVGTITRNANTEIAPNGTLTADNLVFAAADNSVAQAVTIVSGVSYAVSLWIKGTAGQTIRFTSNSIPGGSNVTLTGDWVRYSFVGVSTGTSATLNISTFGGVTARNIYLWGAQLEQSSTVGEYIPTTSTINSAPRFDHNPTTGESLGLLVEQQRTNLLLRSEEFQTTWTIIRASISADATNAPNGTLTADRLIDTTDNNTHVVQQSITLADNTSYAFSVFVKADQLSIVRLQTTNKAGTACLAYFNLLTGAVSNESNATGLISPFQNGWYRCTILFASATGAAAQQVLVSPTKTAGTTFYIGNGTDGLFLWGADLQAGAFPTSYIPTTTAAVTRSADVASITGSAFSGWYRQDEGTMFTDCSVSYTVPGTSFPLAASLSDGTTNNKIENGFLTATLAGYEVTTGGVAQVGVYPNAGSSLARRLATSFKINDFAVSVNGGTINADTSGTVPIIDRLHIGGRVVGGPTSNLFGHIRRLTFWPQRLANSTLQQITQ
jgi:hypothetical protein